MFQRRKLQASDAGVFNVDVEVAKAFGTIINILQDFGTNMYEGDVVDLPIVTSDILKKVIEWATHRKNDPATLQAVKDDDRAVQPIGDISPWDKAFLKVDTTELFELLLAAERLHRSLADAVCKIVANIIKGKTPAEIRAAFNIANDFEENPENLQPKQET